MSIDSDEWLEVWGKDRFTSTGSYKPRVFGQLYGNTDWALAKALHSEICKEYEPIFTYYKSLCAALYQACGAYDMPERVLDALSAAANGEEFSHLIDDILPCYPELEKKKEYYNSVRADNYKASQSISDFERKSANDDTA